VAAGDGGRPRLIQLDHPPSGAEGEFPDVAPAGGPEHGSKPTES
jgi:hypothetical protein